MNQNENKPLTADKIAAAWVIGDEQMDIETRESLSRHIEQYAAQQVKPIQDYLEATVKNRAEVVEDFKNRLKQVTEERDELARLISDSPLCDTVVDPKLQRAWEACNTLCEKAEFKFMFKYMQDLEKSVKGLTKDRNQAIQLLGETLSVMDPDPDTATGRKSCGIVRQVRDFYYSHINAAKEGGE